MSRYMMFIKHSENLRFEEIPQALHEQMGKFVEENLKSGMLIDTAGLQPTSAGTRVSLSGRKLRVTDGPFTESKEVIGGYALVEARSNEEAVDLAKRFMEIHLRTWPEFEGTCEVRPLEAGEPNRT